MVLNHNDHVRSATPISTSGSVVCRRYISGADERGNDDDGDNWVDEKAVPQLIDGYELGTVCNRVEDPPPSLARAQCTTARTVSTTARIAFLSQTAIVTDSIVVYS